MTTRAHERRFGSSVTPGHRWVFVVTGFLSLIVGLNIIYTLFNVLGSAIRAEFGWSALDVSQALTYFLICDGISVVTMGFLISRFGLRRVTMPLAALFGFALASLAALPPSLAYLYAASVIAGLACGPSTQVAHSIVITAWFGKNRGLALGILNAGLGLCGTVTPFAVGALSSNLGWRTTFLIVGAVCGLVPLIAFGAVQRLPASVEAGQRSRKPAGASFGTIARTSRPFWIIAVAIFLISAATVGVTGQIVNIATGQGADLATALALLSTVSLSSIAARFAIGWLLDLVWAPLIGAVVFVLCGVGLLLLSQAAATPVLVIGAVCIGIGLGSEADIAAYVTSRYIPPLSYSRVYGFMIFLFAQGSAIGVLLLGLSLSATGSVQVAAWGIIAGSVVAGAVLLLLGPYRYGTDGLPVASDIDGPTVRTEPA